MATQIPEFILGALAISTLGLIGAIGVAVYLVRRLRGQETHWRTLAREFGLSYTPPKLTWDHGMEGSYQSVPLKVVCSRKPRINRFGPLEHMLTYVTIKANFPSACVPTMTVVRRSESAKKPPRSIDLNDAQLNQLLVVHGADEPAIRALLLRPEVKQVLLDFFQTYHSTSSCSIADDAISFCTKHREKVAVFRRDIHTCVDVALVIATGAEQLFAAQSAVPG